MPSPVILSTWSFGSIANTAGWDILESNGSSIDAVERGCCAVEDDPGVGTVGYGGLPDRTGRVTLDGCVMLSPSRCGSVCCISQHKHAVSIARRVMEQTPHVMLAGPDADAFADTQGFDRVDLLTEEARQKWLKWQAAFETNPTRNIEEQTASILPVDEESHDTVGVVALDARGILAGACSTSGWPFKMPGRVGDSPIIGHGLYVDPVHGAAVATGAGELVMGTCATFLTVESMRRGAKPVDAIRESLQRIVNSYDLTKDHQVGLIAIAADGSWNAGALRPGFTVAVTSIDRNEQAEPDVVLIPE